MGRYAFVLLALCLCYTSADSSTGHGATRPTKKLKRHSRSHAPKSEGGSSNDAAAEDQYKRYMEAYTSGGQHPRRARPPATGDGEGEDGVEDVPSTNGDDESTEVQDDQTEEDEEANQDERVDESADSGDEAQETDLAKKEASQPQTGSGDAKATGSDHSAYLRNIDQAEQELEKLKKLMRDLRRMESTAGAASLLEAQHTQKLQRQKVEQAASFMEMHESKAEGSQASGSQTFPADTPTTAEGYRQYSICNLTLAKAYNLLNYTVTMETFYGTPGWTPPYFVQDVLDQLSSAWTSPTSWWTPSVSGAGWGAYPAQNAITTTTLKKVQVSMAWVSLRTALQSGHGIWTSADQSALVQYCLQASTTTNLEEQSPIPNIVQGDIMITRTTSSLWATKNVPFCYAPGTSTGAKASFQMAIDHISAQIPCLSFAHINVSVLKQPATCVELPSIIVTSANLGCFSYLGSVDLVTQSQTLNLGPGCDLMGMAIHQLMHALGVPHEISRLDRNSYLSFSSDTAESRSASAIFPVNYVQGYPLDNRQRNSSDTFDLLSITMPPASTFSVDGFDTVEPNSLPILGRYMGQRHGLSEADAQNLADLYGPGCQASYPPRTPSWDVTTKWLGGMGFALDGKCADRTYTGIGWTDGLKRNFSFTCNDLRSKCRDPVFGPQTRLVCPVTCLQCIQPPPALQIYANGIGDYSAAQGQAGGLGEHSWKTQPVIW